MIRPEALRPGDRVAIISPATIVKAGYIDGAAAHLRRRGYEPVVMPYAQGPADGSYASSYEHRLSDLTEAWMDPGIKAILCARGGYGAAHLLPALSRVDFRRNAKWLIGFSDISALHAWLLHAGISSIHASMAKHLSEFPDDDPMTLRLFAILEGEGMDYEVDAHPYNMPGRAEGMLAGGNLAVLNGLSSTPYDLFALAAREDMILFIEDISEAIYAVERMLCRLGMAGTLSRVKGLLIGRFTDYRPDRNFPTMEDMVRSLLERVGIRDIPVAFGFPTGHIDMNHPLVEGERVELTVGRTGVRLRSSD